MSKAVISTMKKHMSLEERVDFIFDCIDFYGKNWEEQIHGLKLNELLKHHNIYNSYLLLRRKFTPEELSLTINIKEL